MWNASHLAVRLCALLHWKRVSMPPTTQSLRHPLTRAFHVAPRIKTARRFTAKNPWWQNDFLEGGRIKFPKRFCMVGTRYFASATNCWYPIWYYNYGRTWSVSRPYRVWFFAEGERFLSFWRCHRPRWGERRWWCGVADSSLCLKPQTKGTVLLVCLWHIQTKRTVPLVCMPHEPHPPPIGIWDLWVGGKGGGV